MSNWTNQKKQSSQTPLIYKANKQYNEPNYSYSGRLGTQWSNRTPKN